MFHINIKIVLCILFTLVRNCQNYNLFCSKTITGDGASSYFGYSVQLRSAIGGPGKVIVGAPRSNSSSGAHRDIFQPGAVFSCGIDSSECEQFLFDPEGNEKHKQPGLSYTHRKDDSWLGATLDGADLEDEMLVVCAPRWINSFYSNSYLQTGLCYLLSDASQINNNATVLIPLLDVDKFYTKEKIPKWYYGLGQAGMAVHYLQNRNSGEILIGAPGVLNWQGTMIKYTNPYNLASSKVFNIEHELEEFSYIGSSVSSGKFITNSDVRWYVVGAPRSNDIAGRIYVYEYTTKLEERFKASGEEMGEYFGASLAVGDITGDHIDDIIVGAPLHVGKGAEDSGCVYEFVSLGNGAFRRLKVTGPNKAGIRFGTAVAAIGDINSDGYGDFAVGAPYAGPKGSGAVFIYFGSANGLNQINYLRVLASDVDPKLRGFGISISRGLDVDKNGINDIAVGAYKSGHVVVLHTRGTILVETNLTTDKQEFNVNTKSIMIHACLRYSGKYVADSLTFERTVNFTDDRISFNGGIKSWVDVSVLNKDKDYCLNLQIIVQNNEPDRRDPLIITMYYNIIQSDAACDINHPYQIENAPKSLSIWYQHGCKHDVCLPELSLTGRFNHSAPSLVVGLTPRIQVLVTVTNTGEPAFNCQLHVKVPPYIKFYKPGEQCPSQNPTSTDSHCLMVGKLLQKDEQRSLVLHLQLDLEKVAYDMDLNVKLNVTSSGRESDLTDNVVQLNLPLGREEDLQIRTRSQPKKLTNDLRTVEIVHTIEVTNKAPSPLDATKINVHLPTTINNEKFINVTWFHVYLSPNPENFHTINGSEKCKETSSVSDLEVQYNEVKEEDGLSAAGFNISCDSTERNIDIECIIRSCSYKTRVYTGGHIVVNVTMNVNLALLDAIETSKSTYDIITRVSVVTDSGNEWGNIVKTIVHKQIKRANLTMWILVGVCVAIVILLIIIVILYKNGFFKRKEYENLEDDENAVPWMQATLHQQNDEIDSD